MDGRGIARVRVLSGLPSCQFMRVIVVVMPCIFLNVFPITLFPFIWPSAQDGLGDALEGLVILSLSGNPWTSVPDVAGCTNLQRLSISRYSDAAWHPFLDGHGDDVVVFDTSNGKEKWCDLMRLRLCARARVCECPVAGCDFLYKTIVLRRLAAADGGGDDESADGDEEPFPIEDLALHPDANLRIKVGDDFFVGVRLLRVWGARSLTPFSHWHPTFSHRLSLGVAGGVGGFDGFGGLPDRDTHGGCAPPRALQQRPHRAPRRHRPPGGAG